ncbi:hypothetical protein AAY473_010683 [Plecturocebus cupreus]
MAGLTMEELIQLAVPRLAEHEPNSYHKNASVALPQKELLFDTKSSVEFNSQLDGLLCLHRAPNSIQKETESRLLRTKSRRAEAPAKKLRQPKGSRWQPVGLLHWECPGPWAAKIYRCCFILNKFLIIHLLKPDSVSSSHSSSVKPCSLADEEL